MIRAAAIILLAAMATPAWAADALLGFTVNGKPINPICLQRMQPWLSDGKVIVKSIVLDYCQDSNWAFSPEEAKINGNVVSARLAENDQDAGASGDFRYEVIGRSDSGLYVLLVNGWITAYRIDEQQVKDDLLGKSRTKVKVLTQIGESFVRCLKALSVRGNTLVVEKHVYHEQLPKPDQCNATLETVEYAIAP